MDECSGNGYCTLTVAEGDGLMSTWFDVGNCVNNFCHINIFSAKVTGPIAKIWQLILVVEVIPYIDIHFLNKTVYLVFPKSRYVFQLSTLWP